MISFRISNLLSDRFIKNLQTRGNRIFLKSETILVLLLMCACVIFQLLLRDYGFHGDELYYITIGDLWTFHNLDMLPITPLYLRLFTFLFGYSITTIHLASSFCCSGIMGIACLITMKLGGKVYAILLTGIFLLFAGLVPAASVFTYDAPGHLIWVTALYGVVRALKEDDPRWAILTGTFIGIGMLNKVTILFLPLALIVSLLLVPQRIWLRSRWLWIAGGIIVPFVIPFIVWQFQQNWYFLDFATKYTGEMSYKASFPAFIWNQIIPNNVLSFPVWFMALIILLFSPKWKTYRFFGICYIVLFLIFFLLHSPFYFLMPLYAVLIPIGSIRIEQYMGSLNPGKPTVKIARAAIPIVYFIGSLPLLLLAVPILPVDRLVSYTSNVGVDAGIKTSSGSQGLLPHWFADRFGWEEMAKGIAIVYHSGPPADKNKTGIITGNYCQASAIHVYRTKYGLPEPISTHGWFYYQTLMKPEFKRKYISIGVSPDLLKELFSSVEQKGTFTNQYCKPDQNHLPIYFCTSPKCDLRKRWLIDKLMDSQFKKYMDKEGVFKSIVYYHALKKSDPTILLFTEQQINAVGYEYLNKGKIDEAIALFTLNVEEHPESSNVYDSLGEAYFVQGNFCQATRSYKESLNRNPGNTNAKKYLWKLKKLMGFSYQ